MSTAVQRIEELITDLLRAMPLDAGDDAGGVRVCVTEVDVAMPLESRIDGAANLRAALPRGRLRTGFEAPLGRIRARFARGGP